jgi:GT2 family glycosyltransferase
MNERYYVAICTLGENPNLDMCITQLLKLRANSVHSIEVLVVVNSKIFRNNFPKEVIVEYEPLKGYSNVRNKAISVTPKNASIIFIDDDEIPTENWLDALIIKNQMHPEDVIFGPVFPSPNSPQNTYRGKFQKYFKNLPDNSTVKQAATANMLIPRSLINRKLINFDPVFNSLGSEDTDLCFKLRKAGVKIRYAREAEIYENQDLERTDQKYLDARFLKETALYSLVVRRNATVKSYSLRFILLLLRISQFMLLIAFKKNAKLSLRAHLKSLKVLIFGIGKI